MCHGCLPGVILMLLFKLREGERLYIFDEKEKEKERRHNFWILVPIFIAPLASEDVEIEIIDKLISIPYVEMTIKLMERFGVNVEQTDSWDRVFYKRMSKVHVGDASSASYFLVGAAVTGGIVTVEGCGTSSLHGDVKFPEVMEKMGAKTENNITELDHQEIPLEGNTCIRLMLT
ncbi:3-phosphoshikimate 1-carboxyvinyltransferase 2 [Hibiscus syriacus]|uniref:3-phosphoshikimate 1-carboxyvinyltransferase 2 n=1 Tax=Hibiscus syriacus TaxID=106335 RepID=A0A6A2YCW3_HIBSY|nr:3-phosphoshikimate 1-carboxyvinyltransferase 2 [Hibiscus syriacus]